MEINFTDWNNKLNNQITEFELAYGEIQDKVMNENARDLHTMLMKSDFDAYKGGFNFSDENMFEKADLGDLKNYEKELSKNCKK